MAEVGDIAKGLLKDAHEDFASIPAVVSQLAEFRRRYPAAYQQAYISDSLPALLSVYLRKELLLYDPLHLNGVSGPGQPEAGVTSFLDHEWFREVYEFGGERSTP